MKLRRLTPRQLDEETIRRFCSFRLQHMDLKPEVSLEDDFQMFAKDIRKFSYVWIEEDDNGNFCSTIVVNSKVVEYEGRRVQWLAGEYAYNSKGQSFAWPFFYCFLYFAFHCLRRPWMPTYFAGPSYLPSFLSGFQGVSRVWTSNQKEQIPAFEAGLLPLLAEQACGANWTPDTGLVKMRTLPKDQKIRRPKSKTFQTLYDRYIQENPNWLDGYCVFVLKPVDLRWIKDMSLQMARRLFSNR